MFAFFVPGQNTIGLGLMSECTAIGMPNLHEMAAISSTEHQPPSLSLVPKLPRLMIHSSQVHLAESLEGELLSHISLYSSCPVRWATNWMRILAARENCLSLVKPLGCFRTASLIHALMASGTQSPHVLSSGDGWRTSFHFRSVFAYSLPAPPPSES